MANGEGIPGIRPAKKTQAETIDELMDYLKGGGSLGLELEKKFDQLPKKYSVLLVTRQEKYDLVVANLAKIFISKGMTGIFVTINKSGKDLIATLQQHKVDCTKLFIIDAISKRGPSSEELGVNISYVDSPQNLTEMQAQISDFVENLPPGEHFFILDSLSTMLIYNAEKTVEKFVHSLGEVLRTLEFKAVFTIMESTKPEIMNVLSQFCDAAIKPNPKINP